jgi:hypothetical protein
MEMVTATESTIRTALLLPSKFQRSTKEAIVSKEAPWIALAIDWQDSPMFDDSTHGERLAWICLLCFAKAQGRAGKVRLRGRAFAQTYRLSVESVEAAIARAVAAGAVIVEGDIVTVVNWKLYQDPRVRSRTEENHRENEAQPPNGQPFSKTSENDATKHPPPSTKHPPPKRKEPAGAGDPRFVEFWQAFPAIRKQDRADAWKAWRQAVKETDSAVILAAAKEYAASEVGQGKYAKGPGPWLRKHCWHDDREAWKDHDLDRTKDSGYRKVTADEFTELLRLKKFKEPPIRSKSDPRWVYGTLRDGTKVECKDYPLPSQAAT